MSSLSPFYMNNAVGITDLNLKELPTYLNTQDLFDQIAESQLSFSSSIPNSDGIKLNIAPYMEKLDEDLYEKLYLEPTIENEKNIEIIIIFKEGISIENRNELLKKYEPSILIKYNYKLIPAVSIQIGLKDLRYFIENEVLNNNIIRITKNHILNYDIVSFINFQKEIESNWESYYSEENWWLNAIGMSDVNLTGKNIKLALMDTGIAPHPDFFTNGDPKYSRIIESKAFCEEEGVAINNYTYDDYGHGTHCASIAGGNGFLSSEKYRGVAPGVSLINAKVSNSSGSIKEADVIAAIEWCVEIGANIISMSFGWNIPEVWNAEGLAIKKASEAGVIIVSSAGNSGPSFFTSGSPATALYSISIGATDINNHVASFNSVGPSYTGQISPDVCAPGVNIIAANSPNSVISIEKEYTSSILEEKGYFGYVSLSGTSMACPMVAGAIAILLEAYPDLTPESIRNALINGSTPIETQSNEGYGVAKGAGLINVSKSLEYLSNINEKYNSVNKQVSIFPRVIPFAPFDLIRFPNDQTTLNISLYCGQKIKFQLSIPKLDGIDIDCDSESISLNSHGIYSVSLSIKINYNATIGKRNGFLQIIDNDTGSILDRVEINIDVALPKSKILFESYHGLNDYLSWNSPLYSQIEFYHMMYDLTNLNYSLVYQMENWTTNYNADNDAYLINPQILSGIDIIILQPPILPYSQYEIQTLKQFYTQGGSILFLGTKYQNFCYNSVNSLFETLEVPIKVSTENIFNINDYGLFASYISENVVDLNKSSEVFNGVSQYLWAFGNTYEINNNCNILSKITNLPIAVSYSGDLYGNGNIIALGDYHLFTESIYNDPEHYGNHSAFLRNIIDSLLVDNELRLSVEYENSSMFNPEKSFSINFYNGTSQSCLLSESIFDKTNISIILPNKTEVFPLYQFISNTYIQGNFVTDIDSIFQDPYTLLCDIDYLGTIYSSQMKFFYFPLKEKIYSSITTPESGFIRGENTDENNYLILNTTSEELNFDGYIGVTTGKFLSSNEMDEFNPIIEYNATDITYYINITTLNINTGGFGYFYGFSNNTIKNSTDYYPSREAFYVSNENPKVNLTDSRFSQISLNNLITNGGIYPIQALTEINYEIVIDVEDPDLNNKFSPALNFSIALIPIFLFNGYPNLLNPIQIPTYNCTYNTQDETYSSFINFPRELSYSSQDKIVNISNESDLNQFFSLLVITIRDPDGGETSLMLVIVLFNEAPTYTKFFPLISVISLIVISIVIINFKDRFLRKKNYQFFN